MAKVLPVQDDSPAHEHTISVRPITLGANNTNEREPLSKSAWSDEQVAPSQSQPTLADSMSGRLAANRMLGPLVRSISEDTAPYVETFLCPVCLQNVDVMDRQVLAECGEVSHGLCLECLQQYLQGRIEDGRVDAMPCPIGLMSGSCAKLDRPAEISEDEIQQTLKSLDKVLAKYDLFKKKKADTSLRECPKCGRLCSPARSADGSIIAEMVCDGEGGCGAEFCYYHSWAHREDGNCSAYEARLVRETRANAVAFGTKACPKCTFETEKNGGCNHMTCQRCKCDWCWLCNREIGDDIAWHYNSTNRDGCIQFGHVDDIERFRRERRRRMECLRQARCMTCPVRWITVIIVGFLLFISLVIVLAMMISCQVSEQWPQERRARLFKCLFFPIAALLVLPVMLSIEIVWTPFALLAFLVLCIRGHGSCYMLKFLFVEHLKIWNFNTWLQDHPPLLAE